LNPCLICIEDGDQLMGVPFQMADMLRSQGRPQRGNAMPQPILMKGQQIKITLDNDRTVFFRGIAFGHRKAVKDIAFMVDT
jgi:hypothetical protein